MSEILELEDGIEMTIKDQFLTFEIEGEDYGIPIVHIKEIISVTVITKVPHNPPYVKGIINLRGDIIAVVDVRERFMKEFRPYDESTCIIVIEYGEYSLGLIVDSVKEVVFINEENVVAPPNAKLNYSNQFIKNIGKIGDEVALILDLDKLLNQD
ncbi:MAG: chemotaxis protein CheW [Clostridiales bacterium]|nr:chemotaxis protein CheW [Clostridiales bacterium]